MCMNPLLCQLLLAGDGFVLVYSIVAKSSWSELKVRVSRAPHGVVDALAVPKRLPHPFVVHGAAAVVTEFPCVAPQALHEKILKIKDADRCACVVIGNKKVRLLCHARVSGPLP
jgi:hypothetical protein